MFFELFLVFLEKMNMIDLILHAENKEKIFGVFIDVLTKFQNVLDWN